MADNRQDPLIESLMALAISAAPLIKRARESGMFKAGSREDAASETVVEATVITPEPAKPAATPEPGPQDAAIAALEAEISKLKAAAAKAKAKKA